MLRTEGAAQRTSALQTWPAYETTAVLPALDGTTQDGAGGGFREARDDAVDEVIVRGLFVPLV